MTFDANGRLIEVCDGGVGRRTSPGNNTGDWFSINGDIQVTEFHSVAYDSNFNIIIGGTQDTGTPEQSAPGSATWNSVGRRRRRQGRGGRLGRGHFRALLQLPESGQLHPAHLQSRLRQRRSSA